MSEEIKSRNSDLVEMGVDEYAEPKEEKDKKPKKEKLVATIEEAE